MAPWVYDPHSGGVKIPERVREATRQRIEAHAAKHYAGRYTRLDLRFKGPFCYVDAYIEPDPRSVFVGKGDTLEANLERLRNTPTHLCRLRHFSQESWSVAFYTYSNERYDSTFFASGQAEGTPEEGFDIGAVYLTA